VKLGVTSIPLTSAGQQFFPSIAPASEYRIHEYHRREIKSPAPGFMELGERNQSFLSENGRILTFQGHPELNEKLAKAMLENSPAYMGIEGDIKTEVERRMEKEHDGGRIWARIIEWIGKA
jgi:GMP synthase-like glutamine amidotransferase